MRRLASLCRGWVRPTGKKRVTPPVTVVCTPRRVRVRVQRAHFAQGLLDVESHQYLQHSHDTRARQRSIDLDGHTLAREVIDDVERAEAAPIHQRVVKSIDQRSRGRLGVGSGTRSPIGCDPPSLTTNQVTSGTPFNRSAAVNALKPQSAPPANGVGTSARRNLTARDYLAGRASPSAARWSSPLTRCNTVAARVGRDGPCRSQSHNVAVSRTPRSRTDDPSSGSRSAPHSNGPFALLRSDTRACALLYIGPHSGCIRSAAIETGFVARRTLDVRERPRSPHLLPSRGV